MTAPSPFLSLRGDGAGSATIVRRPFGGSVAWAEPGSSPELSPAGPAAKNGSHRSNAATSAALPGRTIAASMAQTCVGPSSRWVGGFRISSACNADHWRSAAALAPCPDKGQRTASRAGMPVPVPPAARQPRGRLTPASAWPAASPVAVANGSRLRHQAATPSPPRRTRCPNSCSAHSGDKTAAAPHPSDHQVQRSTIAHLSSASPPHSVHSTEATSKPSPLTAERGTGTGYASSARERRADRPSATTCGCAARSRGRRSRHTSAAMSVSARRCACSSSTSGSRSSRPSESCVSGSARGLLSRARRAGARGAMPELTLPTRGERHERLPLGPTTTPGLGNRSSASSLEHLANVRPFSPSAER